MFTDKMLQLVGVGILETFYMTLSATALAYLIGLPLGLVLVISDPAGIHPMPKLNKVLGAIINFLRAAPFLILLMLLIPFTRLLIGTTIGASAMVPPLFIAAFPFVARMVESSVKEVDAGVVEAAQSMGASTLQIVCKVLLPEAKPSLLLGATIAITTILGYSAMAGIVGGGGLGAIAINYGYYRKEYDILAVMVVFLSLIVLVLPDTGRENLAPCRQAHPVKIPLFPFPRGRRLFRINTTSQKTQKKEMHP